MEPGSALGPIFERNDQSEHRRLLIAKRLAVACFVLAAVGMTALVFLR